MPTKKKTAKKKTAKKKTAKKKTAKKKTAKKKTAKKKTAKKKTAKKKTAKKKTARKPPPGKYAAPHKGANPAVVELADELLRVALDMPDAWMDTPWGERVAKVGKKVFLFSAWYESGFNFSVKLPRSAQVVLDLPMAKPTGYGLGKAGWVSLRLEDDTRPPPLPLVLEWLEESYRTVANKTQNKALDARHHS